MKHSHLLGLSSFLMMAVLAILCLFWFADELCYTSKFDDWLKNRLLQAIITPAPIGVLLDGLVLKLELLINIAVINNKR